MLTLALGTLIAMQNILPNPGFEDVLSGKPVGWTTTVWGGRANFQLAETAHTGKYSVKVESEAGADASWHCTVQVKPFSTYKLSAWIKTENVVKKTGLGALLNLHARPEKTSALTGNTDWTLVETDIQTGADDSLTINCLLGYFGTASGTAYYDDLSLELVSTQEINPTATIDATKNGEPISKYIYSQFIEHLGKCIYGGIWAEMLEDRKFFHFVGSRQSPWKATAQSKVEMIAKDAFVGEHSPRISGGIQQGGLWLVKGKEYTGHIWLNGDSKSQTVNISLQGQTVQAKAPAKGWAKAEFKFKASANTKVAQLKIEGKGPFRVGTVTLMPADNVHGMRPDTLKLLKELNAPLYRWPGGNFVSGYDWRDGIGDRDRRPPRKNPAWQGIEHNDFGTHEFLDFCKLINTEPLIVVNTGFGDAHSAAEWVQYVNGKPETDMGKKRIANGRREPWKVTWWGIGNEMFGSWQLGYMALDQYTIKHNIVYDRMTKVDPRIKTIGVGEVGGDWSKGMLTSCADQMDLISEHFYCQERPGVMAHVAQIPNAIKAKVAAHRRYRDTLPSLKGKNIKIAMDEWNYWYGPYVFGELGTRYYMKDALGIAAGLHEFYKSTDIVGMAQYAQTVNVIGCIKTTPTDAAFETTGLVLKLYREKFGTIPLEVSGAPEPLYVSAAFTADRKTLTLSVINPTGEEVTLPLSWKGIKVADTGSSWTIANKDPMAFNNPGESPNVTIQLGKVEGLTKRTTVKPYSINLYRLPILPNSR